MKKGIIFDMDGTLWDSAEGVAKSWTRIVNREYDKTRVITVEDIHGVMGKTMDKIAEALFPELSDVKLTWLTESGDDMGADSSKVEDVLGWKYIGVNN